MKLPRLPDNEPQRLAALRSYCVLDTDPELGFDDLTDVAARVCQVPIALVSLIDEKRQWFKSHHGLAATETPRDVAFCAHAILDTVPLVVNDASLDERFADNPLVTGEPHVQFYAGVPLIDPQGHKLGTLCVIDHVPRTLTDDQLDMLVRLARQVVNVLELRRSRNEALATAQAKSEFLATMSHEIRTPLNGVLGMADLLAESDLKSAQLETLQVIRRSGEHLLSVVNDILDFSRLEAQRVELTATDFDLQRLIQDTLAMLNETARAKQLALKFEWRSARSVWRRGDPQRVRQILLNLLGNAIKFTNKGSVIIEIADRVSEDGLQITVSDTGVGMDAQALSKLFERFSQADGSIASRFGGTGLGLVIARQLARLMNGDISVSSTLGQGSRFTVSIDLPTGTQTSEAPPAAVELLSAPLVGYHVLVAEDEPVNALLITRMLEKYGPTLTVVGSGADAVKACRETAFDLILMDCMMPEMDGYEAAGAIRALNTKWSQSVPIAALTANALSGDRERCILSGMTDYLTKPVRRADLDALLVRLMNSSTSTAAESELDSSATTHVAHVSGS